MHILDWAVLTLYAVGMLAAGWYYSRRTATTDDFLLGGRNMSPWMVGLSLFATLLSTLTYLAIPGEMIQFGPMVLSQLVAIPFICLVVGWLLIPLIMRQRVTSAYEILEMRFGLGVRMLGSCLFLSLRLFWMSLVIYATASKVLVPILQLDPSAVRWVCVTLGLLTVAYTSMGGLRAVVLTDVVQTFILFGGAALVLILIAVDLGGVGAWWPREWPSHWQRPVFWIEPNVRFTFAGGFLSYFTWYVCTAGSDQMAVQRYLATRDAPAARRMFNISLLSNVILMPFLAVVGLALMAYFLARPDMLPAGQTVWESDELLPVFIMRGLPVGISGLIIAALLAAAMSSLSSGLNSVCSVVTSDFIDRFHKRKDTERSHVRLAKYMSLAIGIVVVVLSTLFVHIKSENLLEMCYKVANLLTVPLFMLFFMAMFIPWATAPGTWAGTVVSLLVVVAIAYQKELELDFMKNLGVSFVWMMPASFVSGAMTGMLVSLLPFRRRPMLA
ncbi:MAG: sodium/solute symporter [Thermoguttaceae bacterium]|jgi:SSS family solute:Na+ symporter|nr:sodium/solute symporter [Thermoguttaceae bacterium]